MITSTAHHGRAGLLLTSGLLVGCGVQAPATPAPPPPSDIVVLAADPETGSLGRALVQAQGATIELATDLSSTRVAPGQPPGTPTTISPAEFQQRFGPVLAARAPQPLQFLLYFETGGDVLTPESQAALGRTVEAIRVRPAADVSVIGHTDTTGDAARNAFLGRQRADLVRDRLVAAGIPAAQVDASSHGEADLLVPTADNVAEARNRRVEITVR